MPGHGVDAGSRSDSTASSSPSTGQTAWLVSQNAVQSAMVLALPGSAGKSMSPRLRRMIAPGLMIDTQLPGLPVVDSVASPPASADTVPSGTCQEASGQNVDVWFHEASSAPDAFSSSEPA